MNFALFSKTPFKIILSFIVILLFSCNQNNKENKDSQAAFKENLEETIKHTPETIKDPSDEEWIANLYRNKRYKFRVEFPPGWEYLSGAGNHILSKAINRPIGATISILVQEYPEKMDYPDDSWKYGTIDEIKTNTIRAFELQNIKPYNLKVTKGYLNNFHAFIISSNDVYNSGSESYEYYTEQIQASYGNRLYQVTLNLPSKYYNEEAKLIFRRVIDSFKFEIAF